MWDYDDTPLEENASQRTPSQRDGLSVGQSSLSVSERTGRPVVERTGKHVMASGQGLDACQAESMKHELQADYDTRSVQNIE